MKNSDIFTENTKSTEKNDYIKKADGFCWPLKAISSMMMYANSQQTTKDKWSSEQKLKQKPRKCNKANWERIKNEINAFIDHIIKTNIDIKKLRHL